jgi:hypothetical protein
MSKPIPLATTEISIRFHMSRQLLGLKSQPMASRPR